MTIRSITLTLCLHGGLLSAVGQTAACTPTDKNPCPAPKASVAQQFPYPGETPEVTPPEAKSPDAPGPVSAPTKDRFPYPGEQPESPTPGDSSSGSSSSSPAAPTPDPDGKPDLKDEGSQGSTGRQRRRLRPPAQKILSDQERVDEDLSIAHFYQQTGNFPGAYLRAKDAVKLQPQTPEAHLALAEVAQKMQKRDEAIAEYNKYLELDPDGEQAKSARKSLEKLKP